VLLSLPMMPHLQHITPSVATSLSLSKNPWNAMTLQNIIIKYKSSTKKGVLITSSQQKTEKHERRIAPDGVQALWRYNVLSSGTLFHPSGALRFGPHDSNPSRDRLSFSKSILRRFLRDCVDRDAALASPWTVKAAIADRYGVTTVMPDAIRQGVENIKKGELEKRKKVWEDKEGPPSKKQKKLQEARGAEFDILHPNFVHRRLYRPNYAEQALSIAAELREREQNKEQEEAQRLAEEKKKQKKKPLRYPTEDLDVKLGDKELKAGAKLQRPIPRRDTLPFGDDQRVFESFLMVWNFFMAYG
jgi:hypothetical protein